MNKRFDVLVVGAGPSGLSVALALAKRNLKVCVLEKATQHTVANPQPDGREIALTHTSKDILTELGLWHLLDESQISRIDEARVVNANLHDFMTLADVGHDKLAYVVSNHLIRKHLFDLALAHELIELKFECAIEDLVCCEENARVVLGNGDAYFAPLVLAADSRFSQIRKMAGISARMKDFGKTMILCQMEHTLEHHYVAHECFLYGKTLAVLPLNGKKSSVVYTVKPSVGREIMSLSDEDYGALISEQFEQVWGKMQVVGKRYAYPLMGTYADYFYSQRLALIGDAAVGMHPVTAHGFNFALRGQETLLREIDGALERGGDIGSESILRAYDQIHKATTKPLYIMTNGIVDLYTNDSAMAKILRKTLLNTADVMVPIKRYITNKLMEKAS